MARRPSGSRAARASASTTRRLPIARRRGATRTRIRSPWLGGPGSRSGRVPGRLDALVGLDAVVRELERAGLDQPVADVFRVATPALRKIELQVDRHGAEQALLFERPHGFGREELARGLARRKIEVGRQREEIVEADGVVARSQMATERAEGLRRDRELDDVEARDVVARRRPHRALERVAMTA